MSKDVSDDLIKPSPSSTISTYIGPFQSRSTSGSNSGVDADTELQIDHDRIGDLDTSPQAQNKSPNNGRPTVHYPDKIASERGISSYSIPTYHSSASLTPVSLSQDDKAQSPSFSGNTSTPNTPSTSGCFNRRAGEETLHRNGINRIGSSDITSAMSSEAPSLAGTYDDEEEEIYDWNDEDDLVDEEAKFEEKMGFKKTRERSMLYRSVVSYISPHDSSLKFVLIIRITSFFLSTLIGSTLLAGIIATPPILLTTLYLNHDKTAQRQYLDYTVSAWMLWVASNLPISWALALIVDISPGIYTWFVFFVWGHVSEGIKNRVELYISVKDTFKPVLYAASIWVSWVIIFEDVYELYDSVNPDDSRAPYTPRVSLCTRNTSYVDIIDIDYRFTAISSSRIFVLPRTCHMRTAHVIPYDRFVFNN